MNIGARYLGEGNCTFTLWAPHHERIVLKLAAPSERVVPMKKDRHGYWRVELRGIEPGTLYLYQLSSGRELPDPASHFQPQGVHGPSEVIDHRVFAWEDGDWKGIPLEKMVMYELHIGTFTPQGNFEAVIPRLPELKELGINAVQIMPVGQFPGEHNWGYDGAYPFSVQDSYGGPAGLKELVNEAHRLGMAVILDVVYNHLGPEGNYLAEFGPYFTDRYHTPWGRAINFDDRDNRGVRDYFVQNALHWFDNYHVDALRLDAIHGIFDQSKKHILAELAEETDKFSEGEGRQFYLIAESDLNQEIVVRDQSRGGYGVHAQWCDDFHHCLHSLLTEEKTGYYADFGRIEQLEKSFREGFVYSGQRSVFRGREHGTSSREIPASRFVVFAQNHDQVGNRLRGDRLSALVSFDALKLAAGAVLVSPYIPLLFMGEEYAEENPFLYFVSHTDPALVKAVREGRQKEFAAFGWEEPVPDPLGEATFYDSKINWEKRNSGKHRVMLKFYHKLLGLRRAVPALANLSKSDLRVGQLSDNILLLERWRARSKIMCIMNFSDEGKPVRLERNGFQKLLDSAEPAWLGSGSAAPDSINGPAEIGLKPFQLLLYHAEGGR